MLVLLRNQYILVGFFNDTDKSHCDISSVRYYSEVRPKSQINGLYVSIYVFVISCRITALSCTSVSECIVLLLCGFVF